MSKKGENIYKRKDNRWEARYVKGYKTDGTARYGYCYGKTYREAKEKVTEAKAALLTNMPMGPSNRRKFGYYCDEWLLLKRTCVKESTYVKYMTILENHVKPQLGAYMVQALSSVLVEHFSHSLLCDEELSPKSVKDILTVLQSIIKYTAKHFQGPMPTIDIIYPKDHKKEMRVLSREEQERLVKFLLTDIDECKFGVLLALLTGLRIGEVCALRWKDISLKDRTIDVSLTMQRLKNLDQSKPNKTKIVITEPKSDGSDRIIPLNDYATRLCKRRWVKDSSAFVLTGTSDRYIEPRTLQNKLKFYAEECGIPHLHFHTLRHTFATRCVEVGFEIKSLSEILGHSNPRITLERYVHSSMELKRDNMDKLALIGY